MNIVEDSFEIRDRLRISVIRERLGAVQNKDTSMFVLANNAEIHTGKLSGSGAFVAHTAENAVVTGDFVAVIMHGHCLPETTFVSVNRVAHGHLSYIDGCTNSNLINPPRNGDPCVNYLHFPEGTDQTMHLHPSVRIGLVLAGAGFAVLKNKTIELKEGMCFVLERQAMHRFVTNGSMMSLIVFHPDSDGGPQDEMNPMFSRTYMR